MNQTPYLVALTGGIACGKTVVSDLFAEKHGVPVIDADHIAHQLVQVGMPALEAIKAAFGKTIINADGTLNRAQLREIIFADKKQRKTLERVLHPLIYKEMWQKVGQISDPYCILSIPLFTESEQTYQVDKVLVVDCLKELQIQRLKIRNNFTDEHIALILEAQATREARLLRADDIITNNADRQKLTQQVDTIHLKYLDLAKNHKLYCD